MKDASQRKDICFTVYLDLLSFRGSQNLWCYVAWSSTLLEDIGFLIDPCCQSKVTDNVAFLLVGCCRSNQNVLQLQISVHNSLASQMLQCIHKVLAYSIFVRFIISSPLRLGLLHLFEQRPSGKIFEHCVDKLAGDKHIVELNDVGMVQNPQRFDFIFECVLRRLASYLTLLIVLQFVKHLDSELLAIRYAF